MKYTVLFQLPLVGCMLSAAMLCGGGCPGSSSVSPGGAIIDLAPQIADGQLTGVFIRGTPTSVSLSADVSDPTLQVNHVTADLSVLGGPVNQSLQQISSGHWAFAGTLVPPVAKAGAITLTAANALGIEGRTSLPLHVLAPGSTVTVRKNALGSSTLLDAPAVGKVFVPSQYGGQLTVTGASVNLIYTDGSDLTPDVAARTFQGNLDSSIVAGGNPCVYTVPLNKQGWYYIVPTDSDSVTISSSFVEDGQATYRPWNSWWWAWNPIGGPTLYEAGGPFEKYDRVYGTQAQAWAAANESGGQWWWGHCWGWSIASILLPEPKATTKNGVAFTSDDMKGLYVALADKGPYIDPDLSVKDIPAGPLTAATGEIIDLYCYDVHRILHTCICQNHVPVQCDMRASAVAPGREVEIWNQAIYKYLATFSEAPGLGNEYLVQIDMQVWANYDLQQPPTDDTQDRTEHYVYQLEFDSQGQVIPRSDLQNWISASHYPPRELHCITGSPWSPNNPYLTRARIDGLYQP